VSIVAPITATSAIVPVSVGLIQGERPRWLQLVGIGMAMVGVVMASHQIRRDAPSDRRFTAGVGLGLGAALSLGCFLIALHEAGKADPFWAVFLARGAAVMLLGSLLLGSRTRFSLPRSTLAALLAIGLLDTTAITLYAVASQHGMVSLMSVLASLYPVSTVILARLFLQERTSVSQRAGTVTVLAGIALIAAFQ
jgi:drug/metabolite transporter (DMT)-like permease